MDNTIYFCLSPKDTVHVLTLSYLGRVTLEEQLASKRAWIANCA